MDYSERSIRLDLHSPDTHDHSDYNSSAYETQSSSSYDTDTANDTDDSLYASSSSSPGFRPTHSPHKQSYYQANDLKLPVNSDSHLYYDHSPITKSHDNFHSFSSSRHTPRLTAQTPLLERSTSNQSNASYQLVSETLTEQEPSELVRFMVTVDTDLQTFLLRCLSVLLASLVVFSLNSDLSAWHAVITAPTLVFGLVVFFHASSDHSILRNLFIGSCFLTAIQATNCLISILVFDSTLSNHLWDIALLVVVLAIACSLCDLYLTKQRLTNRYTTQYYEDVKRTHARKLSLPAPAASSSDDDESTIGRVRTLSQERLNSNFSLQHTDPQQNPLSILQTISLLSHERSVPQHADAVDDS